MFSAIKKRYQKALHIGLPAGVQFKEKLKVELSNQFIILGLACVALHNVVNLLFLRSFVDFCLTMVWFVVLMPALILNLFKRPAWARRFLALGGILAVFSLHLLFGDGLRLEAFYILFLVVAALFFESSRLIQYAILVLVLFFAASIINTKVEPVFFSLVKPTGYFTRFIFSVALISALIGKLILENRRYNSVISGQNVHLNKYNQQLKNFNHIISHDLKEPLRGIVGFSQLIKKQVEKGADVNQNYLDHMIRSTKQLDKLVGDLDEFTNSEEKELSKEAFRIEDVVKNIQRTLSQYEVSQNAEIQCQPFPPIISSKLALTIILRNLIENGIKYNEQEKPKIMIDGEVRNGQATIRVQDNGIGIEEQYFERVFGMFNRLNSDFRKGSGLGLNISQNLAHRLKGEITIIESVLGQGSSFQINLPVGQPS